MIQDRLCPLDARIVGNRVACLVDADHPCGLHVAVLRHHDPATDPIAQHILDGRGHGRGRLAASHHHDLVHAA